MIFYYLSFLCAQITETLSNIGITKISDLTIDDYKRAKQSEEGLELRSSADGGSIVNFKEPNPNDEWTFEYTINNINIEFPQSAGIYVWYTDKPITDGTFLGGSGHFVGIMIGLEFLGKNVSIIYSTNDGKYNYTEIDNPEMMTYRDVINPERFRNAGEFRVKVISTLRNFKVEIYDNETLLYDSFRHLIVDNPSDLTKGKYFSITSFYDKVIHSKYILLKEVKLYKREESDQYDAIAIRAKEPKIKARFFEHVEHSNKGVQHLISLIEHTILYTKEHIGKASSMPLFKGLNDARLEIEMLKKSIEKLVDDYYGMSEKPNNTVLGVVEKFASLENKMEYLHKSLNQVKDFMLHYDDKQSNKSGWVIRLVVMGGFFIMLISAIKIYINRKKF